LTLNLLKKRLVTNLSKK